MSVIGRVAPFLTNGGPAVITFVGAVIYDPGGARSYPAGTASGDLVIAVTHDTGAPNTPTGFTSVFVTAADAYGYQKRVSYKIAGGETTANLGSSAGFDQLLVSLRGATSVSSSYEWGAAGSGGTIAKNVPVAGAAIAVASDRGGTGLPGIAGGSPTAQGDGGSTYFYTHWSVYLNAPAGATKTFYDYSDVYNTSCLLFVAL